MFDIEEDYWESELSQNFFDKDKDEEPLRTQFDWVSYVDENYQNEDSAWVEEAASLSAAITI